MQQLKASTGTNWAWPLLAITLSASALTLALCPKAERPRPRAHHSETFQAAATPTAHAEATRVPLPNPPPEDADAAALDALIANAQSDDTNLRHAALDALVRIGGDRAREFLARRFDAASDSELPDLAWALASVGDAQARALLRAAAQSSRPATRSAAFDALATLDSADVREFMVKALEFVDPSPAVSYFSNCREPQALPGLERAARKGDADLRRVAVEALFAQGASAEGTLLRLLRESDDLSDALLEAQQPPPAARKILRRASIARLRAGALTSGPSFDFLQRDLSSEAREALVQAAHDPGSRDSALSALSARGDTASLRALSTLSNDVERPLAERAACAMLSQPDSRWRPFLSGANRASRGNLPDATAAALQRIHAASMRGRPI